MRIKKGDQVEIICGKDRGKRGKVLRCIPKKGKIVIEGLNLAKRHRKPRKEGEKGQRVDVPAAIDSSNAMIVCRHCGKRTAIGYRFEGDRKERTCGKCGKVL
ncbi:MAG: 50S ribosomal protein L24 [Candidatus Moranbacteria bacterium RIFCSPHIGHO2_02_FULL_40_12b]|nr:MAG: 50S ribosomal protein L24 [Candidatus Moranbacteria bacterium RIFCSPHIGHO2_02_FULL_40_12b]OGI22928.1 MAG: 50S ribosomal protein L24 [Candidatus Moranbacteria bacterium RIFCSPHIGHO2_12_FULL_40_10]